MRQPWACPHDNLRPIQARITTFGPEVQSILVKRLKSLLVLFHMFALFSCGGGGGESVCVCVCVWGGGGGGGG